MLAIGCLFCNVFFWALLFLLVGWLFLVLFFDFFLFDVLALDSANGICIQSKIYPFMITTSFGSTHCVI